MVLMSDPSVVLLDEPLAGVNPTLGREIIDHILELVRVKHCTVLIIEHNAKIMLDICDRIVVLNEGRKIADGLPKEIKQNPEVLKAYFGA
jgi:ABC-type branched-subunit amino acid transport system ATPase component